MIKRISLLILFFNIVSCQDIEECSKKKSKIRGIIVPVATPYTNNTISIDKIRGIIKFYAKKNVDGLLVGGKIGEGYLQSEEELKILISEYVKAKCLGLSVLFMVPDSTPAAIRLARYAENIGVDAIVIQLSSFLKLTMSNAQAAFESLKFITDNVKNTPVILYVDPKTKCECVRIYELYGLLTKYVHVFAGTFSDMETALQMRAAGLCKPDHYQLIGNHYAIKATFDGCFDGSVAVASGLVPELAVAIKNAANQKEAAKYQEKINKIVRDVNFSPHSYISSTKAAGAIIGCIDGGGVRAPLKQASCEDRKRITKALQNNDVFVECPVTSCNADESDESDEKNSSFELASQC